MGESNLHRILHLHEGRRSDSLGCSVLLIILESQCFSPSFLVSSFWKSRSMFSYFVSLFRFFHLYVFGFDSKMKLHRPVRDVNISLTLLNCILFVLRILLFLYLIPKYFFLYRTFFDENDVIWLWFVSLLTQNDYVFFLLMESFAILGAI